MDSFDTATSTLVRPRPQVLVFRRELLPYSEGFIANQADALERYAPVLAGTRVAKHLYPNMPAYAVTPPRRAWPRAAEVALLAGYTPRHLRRHLQECVVVHAHFGPDASLLVRSLERSPFSTKPTVVTFHGYDATMSDEGLHEIGRLGARFVARRHRVFARADTIVAVSQFIADRLVEAGADPRKVVVHYIGVDTAFFCPPARRTVPAAHVVFLARLHPKKGGADLLHALGVLASRGVTPSLTIAGAGSEGPELARIASELELPVRFAGAVDAVGARQLLHGARVLCVPSVTAPNGDAEGFGLVFAEAQACGVPVVSYASGGVPEAVAHGETGLLVPERDVPALADALHQLIVDDALWSRMSIAARRRVEKHFDLRTQTRKLESIYDAALGSSAEH